MKRAILIAALLLLMPIYAVAGVVASGSVSLANMKLSTVNGTAFVDFSSAGVFTGYEGLTLTITSVTGGGKLTGSIKAMGTGETYQDVIGGTDPALLNGDFSAGDTVWVKEAASWTIVDQGGGDYEGVATAVAAGVRLRCGTGPQVTGILIKMISTVKNFSLGSVIPWNGYTGNMGPAIAGNSTDTRYYTITGDVNLYLGFNTTVGTTLHIDDVTVQKVLTPSATGCTIVSASGGSVYNWTSTTGTFTLNDAAGYTYTIERPGGGGAIWFTAP